jgi:hypothetical protein
MKRLLVILGFLSFSVTAQKMTIELRKQQQYDCRSAVSIQKCLSNPDLKWPAELKYRLLVFDLDAKTFISYIKDPQFVKDGDVIAGSGSIEVSNPSDNVTQIKFVDPTNFSNYGIIIDKSKSPILVARYMLYDDYTIVEKFVDFKIR